MELRGRNIMGEGLPFTVMVVIEGCTIALTIMTKTVMSKGMSPFVFVVYTNALSSLLLLPFSFLFHYKDKTHQPITFRLLVRFFFLGLTGRLSRSLPKLISQATFQHSIAMAQNLAFVGLSYSSPVVVCAMGLLLPAMSFLIAIFFRKTELDWRNSSLYVKVLGTLISIMGATVVELYIGSFIRSSSPSPFSLSSRKESQHPLLIFLSSTDNWIPGCQLLAASFFSVSLWNFFQQGTVKQYPQVMKAASIYSIFGTIQCTIFSLIVETDMDAWRLKLDMELLVIVLSAVFASIIRSSVHLSFAQTKGPFYVPLFKPFGIVFATIFGVALNSLHYGSVVGATIAGIGYYLLMWGNMREDGKCRNKDIESIDPDMKASLLQKENVQDRI